MENKDAIMSKLDTLKKELDFIKQHIVDITLTQDDFNSLRTAEDDLRLSKTKRL